METNLTAVILGNPALTEFELIAPEHSAERAAHEARGFEYIGEIGAVDGRFRTKFSVPLDNLTVDALAQAYVQFVVSKLDALEDTQKV